MTIESLSNGVVTIETIGDTHTIEINDNAVIIEGGSGVQSVTSTDNHILVDNLDPLNPSLSWQLVDNENLLTDDELAVIQSTSGTNTGDQDLSGLLPTSHLTDFEHENIPLTVPNVAEIQAGVIVFFEGNYYKTLDVIPANQNPSSIPDIFEKLIGSLDPRLSDPRTPTAHKSTHATGGSDALTAGDIGAEPAKGSDDNFVTDAEKIKLSNLSGTNSGDNVFSTNIETDKLSTTKISAIKTFYDWATGLFELLTNKSTTLDADKTSDTKFPSVKSVYDWATGLFVTQSQSTAQTIGSTTNRILKSWHTDIDANNVKTSKIIAGTSGTTGLVIRNNADTADIIVVDEVNKRVGVNITPLYPLHVSGIIAASSSIYANNGNAVFNVNGVEVNYSGVMYLKNSNTNVASALALYSKNIEFLRGLPTQDINTLLGKYLYQATSPTQDTAGDTRFSNQAGVFIFERTIANNATKGAAGNWDTGTISANVKTSKIIAGTSGTTGLVIRNNADTADIIVVDEVNRRMGIGIAPTSNLHLKSVVGDTTIRIETPASGDKASIFFGETARDWVFRRMQYNAYGSLAYDWELAYIGTLLGGNILFNPPTGKNIGINNTLPLTKLDVTGNIRATTNYHLTGAGYFYVGETSPTSDTAGDTRFSNQAGIFIWQVCTIANATKGAGTWVETFRIDTNGFQTAQYDDVLPSGNWVDASGGTAPDVAAHTIGGIAVNVRAFNGGTTEEAFTNSFEILHGIDIDALNRVTTPLLAEIHTHGMPSTTGAGVVKIFFDLVYKPVGLAPIAWGTYSVLITVNANEQYFHKLGGVELPKPSSGFNIGDIITVKYRRTPTDAQDTFTGDWLFDQCAMHMPFNSNGSRQRYVK